MARGSRPCVCSSGSGGGESVGGPSAEHEDVVALVKEEKEMRTVARWCLAEKMVRLGAVEMADGWGFLMSRLETRRWTGWC